MDRWLESLAALARWNYQRASGWVVLIAVLLLFPSPLTGLGFVGTVVLFACRWVAHGSPFPQSRATLPIFLLLVMTAIGFAVSPARDLSIVTAAQVTASVIIFLVVFDHIQSSADLWRAAAVLVLLGILFAFVAPFTANWSPNKFFGVPVFYDSIWPRLPKVTNSNILAGALAPIVPISLALVFQRERHWRALGAVSLAPLSIILILLQSRGALFALGLGLAIWITLYWRWALPLIPLGLIAVLLINNMQGGLPPAQLIYGTPGTVTGGTLFERQDMWAQAIYLIRQSPWVGIGLNAYSVIGPYTFPNSLDHPGAVFPHVHNLFLQVALDTGVIGLAAFVVLIALAVRTVWQAYRASIEKPLAIGLLSAFAVVLAHGLGDVVVWGTSKASIILWILLAMAFTFDKAKKTM